MLNLAEAVLDCGTLKIDSGASEPPGWFFLVSPSVTVLSASATSDAGWLSTSWTVQLDTWGCQMEQI